MSELDQLFADFGMKKTKQRLAVLSLLQEAKAPLTAEEIFASLSKTEAASLWLSTVYRVLDTMCEKGLVLKTFVSKDHKYYYERNFHLHRHYLICLGCGKMLHLNHCPIHGMEEIIPKDSGFQITDHKLELYGYCQACQKKAVTP